MKKIILLFTALSLYLSASAIETVVTGKVTGGNGSVIRLMTYADQVSYLRTTLAYSQLREDESFFLKVDIDETIYAWIDIGFRKAEIFLQPGQKYEVVIEIDDRPISSSYYDRSALSITFTRDDRDQLNLYIQDFNEVYNDFLLDYAENIRVKGNAASFNAFRTAVELRFKNAGNQYFKDYSRYKTASMELFLRLKSRDKIGSEYLAEAPLLCSNVEYMDFFHLYFEKYFISGSKFFNYNKSYDLINGGANLTTILDSLASDPVLMTAGLRELLLLAGLKELYEVQGFRRDRLMALIKSLQVEGSDEIIRVMAGNLLIRLNRLKPGTPAPGFSLKSLPGGQACSLIDFRGKFVYLAFFDSGNPASQAELSMIQDLYDDFKDKVHFVAISVDKDTSAVLSDPGIPANTWRILHFGNQMELLENYDAVAYPYFVFLDDKGNIISCPAPAPSENIRKSMEAI